MIRYKFNLDMYFYNRLYSLIKKIGTYDYYCSTKPFAYKELYIIKSEDMLNTFTLGLGFNGVKSKDRNLCFLEFNPNKLHNCNSLLTILHFLNACVTLDLSLYDIAIDIPYNKKFVTLVKDKRIYKKFCYDSAGVNVTEYLGTSADAGRVKLYNKTIESNLDYDLTRLELTTSYTDYLIVKKQIPNLLVCGDLDILSSTKLSKSDYVLLQLLWLSDDPSFYYKQLCRLKQQKLKPFVSSNFSLNFSEKVMDFLLDIVNFFKNF